jgi:hypothetical protein
LSSLLELDDVRDELDTLQKLFSTQKKVIDAMMNFYSIMDKEDPGKRTQSIGWLKDASDHVNEYSATAVNLSKDCGEVVKSVW